MLAAGGAASWAESPVDVRLTPAIRQYCHIVRFPQGWRIERYFKNNDILHTVTPLYYDFDSAYEFRVPGVLETTFLVRGLVLPYKKYTINKYKIDLSDPAGVARPATEEEWQNGTIVPDIRLKDYPNNFALLSARLENDQPLSFHAFRFVKSGDIWVGELARLSPDQRWIVLLSSSGSIAHTEPDVPLQIPVGRDKGKLFMDVYSVDTGKKLITIVGTYVDINPEALNQALWVTERYFILPLGEHRERCLVCEFGRAVRSGELRP